MILQAMLNTILFLFIVVVLIDLFPIVKDWVQRIRIGKFEDLSLWNEALIHQGSKWLLKTPKIKVADNNRLIVIDMLKGNYTKSTIQHWQEASLIFGLSEYLKHNDDQQVRQRLEKFLSKKFDSAGQWVEKPEHVDGAILAYAVMHMKFIDSNQYKTAYDYIWELIQQHIGKDGTVEYRKHMKGYRYVDTIGFVCAFLVAYGIRYGKDECVDLAIKQIKEYEKYGMLVKHGIPCHVYKIDNKVPVGLSGWGRGLGWFAIGLIDAWNELSINSIYKTVLEESVKKFAKAAIVFQQENGSWNWTITRSESQADSSTTAALVWFLLNASHIQDISRECIASANKAIGYLMKVTRRNGAVDFSQGDTKDIGVYSMLFNILPFTQGLCIRSINVYLQQNKMVNSRF